MVKIHYRFLGWALNWLTWDFRGKMALFAKNHDFAKLMACGPILIRLGYPFGFAKFMGSRKSFEVFESKISKL